jgi:hypothetical protein
MPESRLKRPNIPLPDKQREFAEYLASGEYTKSEAYLKAYGKDNPNIKNPSNHANKLLKSSPRLRTYIEQLQQAMRYKFVEMAPAAQERLESLAASADSEKVKLQANIEILDRAGLKPPERVEMTQVSIFGEASLDDIRNIVRRNLEGDES